MRLRWWRVLRDGRRRRRLWRRLLAGSSRTRGRKRARALGLKRGDQVTTVLPNSFEQVAFALAAFQGGFYYTPVNWHLVGPEIAYIVNDSETKAFIVSDRFAGEEVRVLAESNVAATSLDSAA